MAVDAPLSLKATVRPYLKRIWKGLPPSVRELSLKAFCLLRVGFHRHVPVHTDAPVYVIGSFRAGGGIARSAHLYAEQIHEKHRDCVCVDAACEMLQTIKSSLPDDSTRPLTDIRGDTGPGTVIIHLNPPQFLWLLCLLGRRFLRHKHIVAYWNWEFEDLPSLWKFALRFVDAVEVPTSFTQAAVARNTKKPVTVLPHVVPEPAEVKQIFAQDGKLRCLFMFDMPSLCSRKNPQAVIAAFVQAFTPEEATLTIKVSQAAADAAAWENLQAMAAPHAHVHLISEWMNEADLERLFLEHDVYISLHRSEGYGLTIREAIMRNLYVVATGWSGNMDFMRGERVFPVPYTLLPVNKAENAGILRGVANPRWAEADTAEAAAILRRIHRTLIPCKDPAAEQC